MATMNPEEPRPETTVGPEPERRHDGGETRSMGTLVRELMGETTGLARAEIALVRSEMQENLAKVQRGATSMGAGGVLVHAGVLALVACGILLLSLVWAAWVAALVIGAGLAIIGAILLAVGKRKATTEAIKPQRTIKTVERTRDFVRNERSRAMEKWR